MSKRKHTARRLTPDAHRQKARQALLRAEVLQGDDLGTETPRPIGQPPARDRQPPFPNSSLVTHHSSLL